MHDSLNNIANLNTLGNLSISSSDTRPTRKWTWSIWDRQALAGSQRKALPFDVGRSQRSTESRKARLSAHDKDRFKVLPTLQGHDWPFICVIYFNFISQIYVNMIPHTLLYIFQKLYQIYTPSHRSVLLAAKTDSVFYSFSHLLCRFWYDWIISMEIYWENYWLKM